MNNPEALIDFLEKKAEKAESDLKAEQDSHTFTLNCLKDVLVRLKSDTDINTLVRDIEDYLRDSGRE